MKNGNPSSPVLVAKTIGNPAYQKYMRDTIADVGKRRSVTHLRQNGLMIYAVERLILLIQIVAWYLDDGRGRRYTHCCSAGHT